MKPKTQPIFLLNKPIQIQDSWEVRLPLPVWDRIRHLSGYRKCSYSRITRYCIFRLAEYANLRWSTQLTAAYTRASCKSLQSAAEHRHIVCFYGQDIILVRMAALRLGITVSGFIRLALELYLPRLELEIHSQKGVSAEALFWLGIKRWLCIPLTAINTLGLPTMRRFLFSGFPPETWWKTPPTDKLAFTA